ncbi:MAG: zinc-binding dehydrogenase [Chloroflexi bacterium]|nr:zinc-binding dehydrogenase [Chloroflexota bacterium]
MKAILLDEHGGPEKLKLAEFPTPEPGPGQVLVRSRAAALNRVDILVREGWPGLKLEYPHIPGADGAGTVVALGAGVTAPEIGTPVVINGNLSDSTCEFCLAGLDNQCRNWNLLGETIRGTYAEYVAVPARNALPIPADFDPHAAAAAALVFLTAWHSLIVRGNLRAGEKLLVVGASGGVNTACIQVAKLAGAQVYVVGSGRAKLDLAESLGADSLIDRSQEEDWSRAVFQLTDRQGVDVVVDNVGTTYAHSLRALRKGGRLLTVGNTGAPKFEFDNRYMFGKHLSIIGSTMGTHADFRTVMGLVFAGALKPVMDMTFPLAEAAAAQQRLAQGEQMGKITLDIP